MIKAYIIPIYDYCLDIWAVATDNELTKLQKKIDRLLIGHFLPSIVRKYNKNKITQNGLLDVCKIDVNPILNRCHMLTISERLVWTLVKNVRSCIVSPVDIINSIYKLLDNQRTSRTFPLLSVESSNSITLRKSIKFRAIRAWNSLPKEWNFYNDENRIVSDEEFKKKVFSFLIRQRSNLWFNL